MVYIFDPVPICQVGITAGDIEIYFVVKRKCGDLRICGDGFLDNVNGISSHLAGCDECIAYVKARERFGDTEYWNKQNKEGRVH